MDHALRRARVAARLDPLDVDALFVTRPPNVLYLTGFTGSNGQLLVTADAAVLFTDGRYDEQSRREAPDVERVVSSSTVPPVAAQAASRSLRRIGFETDGVTHRQWDRLRHELAGVELVATSSEVEELRRVKDADELDAISAAQASADAAFEEVVLGGGLHDGVTEREVALRLEVAMRAVGADDRAFDTIVAFGEQAAEPHHRPTDRALRPGDLVKIDFGAIAAGYHSDMTRTVAFGQPTPRLRELRDLVAAAQAAGIAAVHAGATAADVDRAARGVVEEAGLGTAFGHGLGHGVGLEIHEAPTLRWDNEDESLPVGAVVTVEPGVYIPGLGGVRIEDMVEVTADGCRPIPRSTKELVVL